MKTPAIAAVATNSHYPQTFAKIFIWKVPGHLKVKDFQCHLQISKSRVVAPIWGISNHHFRCWEYCWWGRLQETFLWICCGVTKMSTEINPLLFLSYLYETLKTSPIFSPPQNPLWCWRLNWPLDCKPRIKGAIVDFLHKTSAFLHAFHDKLCWKA